MTKNIQERELLNDDAEVCAHLIGHASLLHRHAPCAYRASRLTGYWTGAGQILPLAPGAPGGTGMRAGFHRCRGLSTTTPRMVYQPCLGWEEEGGRLVSHREGARILLGYQRRCCREPRKLPRLDRLFGMFTTRCPTSRVFISLRAVSSAPDAHSNSRAGDCRLLCLQGSAFPEVFDAPRLPGGIAARRSDVCYGGGARGRRTDVTSSNGPYTPTRHRVANPARGAFVRRVVGKQGCALRGNSIPSSSPM